MESVNKNRVRTLKYAQGEPRARGPVAYWMSRDQRATDNWALLHAQDLALERSAPLAVVFCLAPAFPGAALRHYDFMLAGLAETAADLRKINIPFFLLCGDPVDRIPRFIEQHHVCAVVADFDPLRIKRQWKQTVAGRITIPLLEVDAHNIAPCWAASHKREYGAYTIRPKINRTLDDFFVEFPKLRTHPVSWRNMPAPPDAGKALAWLKPDAAVSPGDTFTPGPAAGARALGAFIKNRFADYAARRNDPNAGATSGLSPWLHFGHLAPQRAALEIKKAAAGNPDLEQSAAAFLEELIVRRELSDNYCLHNESYDSLKSIPGWARDTLDAHRGDTRAYVYSREQWEAAATHDPLWNAAQRQMMRTGAMHGYMRMYWGKKILEWSACPDEAFDTAVFLNDRYALDGRDPNGYTGIAWCLGGVHDRAWRERPVFGKIRYMNAAGCGRKFDVRAYVEQWREN